MRSMGGLSLFAQALAELCLVKRIGDERGAVELDVTVGPGIVGPAPEVARF
jgi:hypothetical protein